MTMKKRNFLGLFVGLYIGLVTVLGMSLFIFINLKYHSVYYAQHIPHKEGTEPDLVMLVENMGWIYTPKIVTSPINSPTKIPKILLIFIVIFSFLFYDQTIS